MSVDRTNLFTALAATPCGDGRWVVAGSGPMLAMGMIDSIEDIDIVADARAWAVAQDMADRPVERGMFGDRKVSIRVDEVDFEIFDGWLGTDAEALLAEAIEIDGHRFVPLERVIDSKRRLRRPKDLAHLDMIAAWLRERRQSDGR